MGCMQVKTQDSIDSKIVQLVQEIKKAETNKQESEAIKWCWAQASAMCEQFPL